MQKKIARLKRAQKTRKIISELGQNRMSVHRTPRHMYVQITTPDGSKVLVSSSTLEAGIKADLKNTGNIEAAKKVGESIARKALATGVTVVAFDRSGFKYHGRIKALADAARECGLVF